MTGLEHLITIDKDLSDHDSTLSQSLPVNLFFCLEMLSGTIFFNPDSLPSRSSFKPHSGRMMNQTLLLLEEQVLSKVPISRDCLPIGNRAGISHLLGEEGSL